MVDGLFGGIKERDDENVQTEEGAGDAEDDEERGFHGMGLRWEGVEFWNINSIEMNKIYWGRNHSK